MNQLDVYYRALLEYKALTSKDRDTSRLTRAIAAANTDSERIVVKRGLCEIDEEWVNEIEKGLVFVEKAIREERQFIYSNGEVVPIEKVKNVSKESVVHLAKHSDLITRLHEGEDIVPDKLYTVERLNDYTVYENRFLYMLLCYLRDFVTLRYNNILDATNKYEGNLCVNKELTLGKQTLKYTLNLEEVKKDDKFLREHNEAKGIIDRMDLILKTILALLATPLMEYQAKAPMLRPPITKTNVLRMDNDFKGAVALYDFIVSYDKPGYTITQDVREVTQFGEEIGEEMAEIGALMSFLTYEYGLGIKSQLKKSYAEEEDRRRVEAVQKQFEKIESIKRKLLRSEVTAEEYILEIEKQLRMLKKQNDTIEPLTKEIAELKDTQEKLNNRIIELNDEIRELNDRILIIGQDHIKEIDDINKSYSDRIAEIMKRHDTVIQDMRDQFNSETNSLRAHLRETDEKYRNEIAELNKQNAEKTGEINSLKTAYAALEEQKTFCDARIHAYMYQNGEFTQDDNFTSKEQFQMLEREFAAFEKFFGGEWKKTKKQIRKDLLSMSNLTQKEEKPKKKGKKQVAAEPEKVEVISEPEITKENAEPVESIQTTNEDRQD